MPRLTQDETTRHRIIAALTTDDLATDLREFQTLYGDAWRDTLVNFNLGRPSDGGAHLVAPMRRIRNSITASPAMLPDLR